MATDIQLIKPLLRWAGGKRKLAPTICDLFPTEFWSGPGRYFEPFVGGAAVAIEVAKKRSSKEFYLSDTNEDLINLYKTVQIEPEKLIAYISNQDFSNTSDCYYRVRRSPETDPIARAARTLYLNATCFNGLYRTNAAKHPLIVALSQMSEDECLDYIAKHSDYEPTTRQRRHNCLKAWFKECGLVPPTQTTKQEV